MINTIEKREWKQCLLLLEISAGTNKCWFFSREFWIWTFYSSNSFPRQLSTCARLFPKGFFIRQHHFDIICQLSNCFVSSVAKPVLSAENASYACEYLVIMTEVDRQTKSIMWLRLPLEMAIAYSMFRSPVSINRWRVLGDAFHLFTV